jgi:F-type H+-transporting ATPase subunit epsilon
VSLPSSSGYLEVLYAHAPLLAELGPGEVTLHGGDVGDRQLFVAQGFVEVLPDRVTILAESAIPPRDIDVAEARQELDRGQKMWNEAGDVARHYDEANRVIREAEERIAAAERAGKSG